MYNLAAIFYNNIKSYIHPKIHHMSEINCYILSFSYLQYPLCTIISASRCIKYFIGLIEHQQQCFYTTR